MTLRGFGSRRLGGLIPGLLVLLGLAPLPAKASAPCCPKCQGGVCDCKTYGFYPTCWRLWPAGAPTCPPPIPQALIGIPGPVPASSLPPPTPLPPANNPPPPVQMPPAQPPAGSVYARPALPESSAATEPVAPSEPSK